MSFGKPRPGAKKLLVSVGECKTQISALTPLSNSSLLTSVSWNNTEESDITSLDNISTERSYFYLYRISYAWYACIGFVFAFGIGIVTSFFFQKFYYSKKNREKQHEMDPNLFIDHIRKRLALNQLKEDRTKQCGDEAMNIEEKI